MAEQAEGADSGALVFVYGSLKQGMANHHELGSAIELGRASLQGLALYNLGPFPMAVACSEPGVVLHGELYRLSSSQLAALDRFEGTPRLYERLRWPLADGLHCWVYVGRSRQVRHVARIPSGSWSGPSLTEGRQRRHERLQ